MAVHRPARVRRAGLLRGDQVRRRAQERAADRAQRVGAAASRSTWSGSTSSSSTTATSPTAARPPGSAGSWSPSRSHPYLSGWWPPGHTLGWEHTFTHQARDLLTAIADGAQPTPSFADGLRCSGCSTRSSAAPRPAAVGRGRRGHRRLGPFEMKILILLEDLWHGHSHCSPGSGPTCPLEEVCRLASSWGYDGLELACWGDHFEVDRALGEDGYLAGRHALLDKYGLKCWAISSHLVGQAVCDHPIDERHQGDPARPDLGRRRRPRASGSGRRPRSPTPRGRRPRSACGP